MFIYYGLNIFVVMLLRNYSTISVPKEVKEVLERDKGERDWGEYLLILYKEAKEGRKRALEELRRLLSEEDFSRILEESKKFREGFRLR